MQRASSPPETTTDEFPDEACLEMMVHAARQEQALGYDGWTRGPYPARSAIERLVKRGLAIRDRGTDWVMPSEAGFAMIEKEGHA